MVEFQDTKFYKAFQDFFVNNNKETFLQVLAEFYNRTEDVINKNDIQDDLIKELREMYVKFNEKGIDENIVREKVEYFIQNSEKIADIILDLNTNSKQLKNIGVIFDIAYPRRVGETSDNARFKRAIEGLQNGDKLLLDNKIYEFTSEKISINKSISIEGKINPVYDNGHFLHGTILKNVGFAFEADGIEVRNLGLESPGVDNTFQGNTRAINNILIENCSAIPGSHAYLFESYEGIVQNVTCRNCYSYGGQHGFISKATDVTFVDCKAYGHSFFGFGCIADNIPAANKKANNRNNKVINCYANNCLTGFICYSRDMHSTNNANGITHRDLQMSNCYAYACNYASFAIGDLDNPPNGVTYNNVINANINGTELGNESAKGLMVGRCSHSICNVAYSRDIEIKEEFNPDILLPNYNNVFELTGSNLVVKNHTEEVIIKVSNTSYTELNSIKCNCSKTKKVTLIIDDDYTNLVNKAGSIILSTHYRGKGSFVVLEKNGNTWIELYGKSAQRFTKDQNLVNSGNLNLDNANLFDLTLTANTSNKVSVTGTADNDIITIMVRPTGNFSFGGFDTSQFKVPSDLPTSLNGNALITQWFMSGSTGKYMCVNFRLSPII